MSILDVVFSRKLNWEFEDYSKIIKEFLSFEIPFTIIKFSRTDYGVEMRLSVPDEKMKAVVSLIKKNPGITIRKAAINVDEDLCCDCGHCVSLCNTGALYFDEDDRRQFNADKCVACQICVDACPRKALDYGDILEKLEQK